MKNISFPLILACIICSLFQSCSKGVKGEGTAKTEMREFPEFTGFDLEINADVVLRQGAPIDFRIEAQENILPLIKTTVSRNTLTIDETERIHPSNDIKVFITMPNLRHIGIDAAGDVSTITPFTKQRNLHIKLNGSGDIDLNLTAKSVEADINGSGTIRLKGSAKDFEVDIDGSGDVEAFDFIAEDADVKIDGSGNCKLSVSNDLDISISGSGDVHYKGSPKIKQKISGSGNVKQAQ